MSSVSPPGSGPPPSAEPPALLDSAEGWTPWSAPLALVVALALALVGALVVGVVAAVFGASLDDPPPSVNIVATVLQDGAFVLAAVLFARHAGPLRPAQLGLRRTRLWPALGWMLLAFGVYVLLGALWAQLVDIHGTENLPKELGVDESTAALVSVCAIVTVLAPIAEETLFRGYIFRALRNWRGPWPAALLTGIAFGAVHAFSAKPVYLLPLAIFGVALCVVRWRTRSLLPCMALHSLNNALAFAAAEDWSGGQTLLLMCGAVALVLVVVRPFVDVPGRAAAMLD